MSLAILQTSALFGLDSILVSVEVHVGSGLPSFTIVGLPTAGVRESRERVRAAIQNSGYQFPSGRITVNLAPGDLPKESSSYDLAIALSILIAAGELKYGQWLLNNPSKIASLFFLGELSLTGTLTPSKTMLAQVLSIAKNEESTIILPYSNAVAAQCISGVQLVGVQSLQEAANYILDQQINSLPLTPKNLDAPIKSKCLSEVKGQKRAKRALEIAAAGRHNLLFSGSPGTGKTMLMNRMVDISPSLGLEASMEAAAIAELAGKDYRFGATPFRQPHHSSSSIAIIGGGKSIQFGEITMAHHGALFLDELPEFNKTVLEALRQPLESKCIHLARANYKVSLPADFQLLAAMNPCPCGWRDHPKKVCACTEEQVLKYRNKISGPIIDRFDLQAYLHSYEENILESESSESSADVLDRVQKARSFQLNRQSKLNGQIEITDYHFLQADQDAIDTLNRAIEKYDWSARSTIRVLRVARTIADLALSVKILQIHIIEAIQYKPKND